MKKIKEEFLRVIERNARVIYSDLNNDLYCEFQFNGKVCKIQENKLIVNGVVYSEDLFRFIKNPKALWGWIVENI
ncbi:MAG: hypothetical protein ACTSV7_06750 [Candidatus Baldrarchaeia archaeon]